MGSPFTPFQRVALINLRRREDRRKTFLGQAEVSQIPSLTIVDAVDGHKVPAPINWTAGAGAWGCMQSHRQLLQTAIQDDIDTLLVFEDDAVFLENFTSTFETFLRTVPSDWDGLMLGGQHMQTPVPVSPGVVRCLNCQRTHAYALRGRYLREVYRRWISSSGHCDHIMGPMHRDFKVYAPDPFIVAQGPGASDITCRNERPRSWSHLGPRQLLLVTTVEREVVERLKEKGAHVGYWVDDNGFDKGVVAALSLPHSKMVAGLKNWFGYVSVEAAAMIQGVPLLWHPWLGKWKGCEEQFLEILRDALPGVTVRWLHDASQWDEVTKP